MFAYRAILNSERVVLTTKKSISFLNQAVATLQQLVLPFNAPKMFYPFETLADIKLLMLERSFVAGFNVPIVQSEKNFYDIFVDLDENKVFGPNGEEKMSLMVGSCDKKFIHYIIENKFLSEGKILKCFNQYTLFNFQSDGLSSDTEPHFLTDFTKNSQLTCK